MIPELKLVTLQSENSEVLLKSCSHFDFKEYDAPNLKQKMIEICESNNGCGLAAPQVGISKKFFIMKNDRGDWVFVANPTMTSAFDGNMRVVIQKALEGCLSIPGETFEVSRFKNIAVCYSDENGVVIQKVLSNDSARIFQHEYDHLFGILPKDRYPPLNTRRLIFGLS